MVHIYGHTWPVRRGEKGLQKLLKVYSNCDEAELFLNGQSLGTRHRDSQDFPAAGLRWTAVFKPGMNKVLVKAKKGKTVVADSVEFYYETRKWGKPAKIDYEITQENDGITTVEFTVKDKNGVICLDAKNWIRFSYAGEGRMLDDLGTYSGSRKIQLANGRAVMRVDHGEGKGVLAAVVKGLEPCFVKTGEK
jgi:beta-galactosidase